LRASQERDLGTLHMDVNYHGARRVFETLLPGMLERGYGRVVQIGSSAALVGYAYVAHYVASKHALLGYSRSAALELAGKGVGVDVVCPHYVDSPMTDASVERIAAQTCMSEEAARERLAQANPGGQFVTPAEGAAVTLELLQSDQTGRVIELTGSERITVDEGVELTKS